METHHLYPVAVLLFVVADAGVDAVLDDDVCWAHRRRSHRYPLS